MSGCMLISNFSLFYLDFLTFPHATPDQRQHKSDTYTPRHHGLYPKAATRAKFSEDPQATTIKTLGTSDLFRGAQN